MTQKFATPVAWLIPRENVEDTSKQVRHQIIISFPLKNMESKPFLLNETLFVLSTFPVD